MSILVLLTLLFANSDIANVSETESLSGFFTLVAKCGTPTQYDCLVLLKQQIASIGVDLDIHLLDWSDYLSEVLVYRDFDLVYLSFDNLGINPFLYDVYTENGSLNTFGYDVTLDWDEELSSGRNEWYIQTGSLMTPNDSQELIDFCWDWQHYLLDSILPCLPLFAAKEPILEDEGLTNVTGKFVMLGFNIREVRPTIGSRAPAPGNTEFSMGLAIRKALAYAINREEIKNVIFGDDYEVIDCPIPTTMGNWCNPNIIRYCHAIEVARNYLTVAGYDICGGQDPDYSNPYPDWTDWEAVCSRNNQTIDVPGFTHVITSLAIGSLTSISIIFQGKRRKRKEYKV